MQTPADDTQLSIPEAVLLGHALVARVADSLGLRAFFIKGPASVIQGLRLPKVSTDVDVFVSPADIQPLLASLQDRGWRERTADLDGMVFPKHSVTVNHPSWPCHIDIHFRFPGMERDAAATFDAMWLHTEFLELAGQDVRVPSKALGITLLALHSLRAPAPAGLPAGACLPHGPRGTGIPHRHRPGDLGGHRRTGRHAAVPGKRRRDADVGHLAPGVH